MRTATIPHWWLVAVGQYSRLTRPELSALMVVAMHTWDAVTPSPCVTVSYRTLQTRIGASTRVGTIRSVMTLATPADRVYTWSANGGRRGHGMLTRYRDGETNIYELQLDLTRWGWEPAERDKALELAEEARETSLLHRRYPPIVLVVGELLRRHVDRPPLPHDDNKTWTRWCATIHGIMARGYTARDLADAIAGATADPYWSRTLRESSSADEVLADEFEGFLLRGRGNGSQERQHEEDVQPR
jgi:hypothetical protein